MSDVLVHWWITLLFVAVGVPWTKYVFAGLPDSMVGLARPLGIALVGVTVWSAAMIGLVPFNGGGVVLSLLVMGGLGWYLSGGVTRDWLRVHARALLTSEIFFWVGFGMVVYIRGLNPDPWGTERPMDFAFMQSILHSPSFPPLDPWMSGFTINYYYAGYLLAALPITLSGADPIVAYNLALATTAGMVATAAATLSIAMVRLMLPAVGRLKQWRDVLVGSTAIVFVLVSGNLGGFVQVVAGFPEVLALEARDVGRALINGVTQREPLVLSQPFRGWDFDGMTVAQPRDMWSEFNWWNPSRAVWDAIPNGDGTSERRYAITEFPFFSYWLGDMHPHVMALPYGLLLIALALRRMHGALPGWVLPGVLLGLLYPLNSWDYPTYVVLYVAAVVWSGVRQHVSWQAQFREAVLTVAMSYLAYLPFHTTFHSLVGASDPLTDIPVIASLSRYFGLAPAQTELHGLLIMFGLFLVPIIWMTWHYSRDHFERTVFGIAIGVAIVGSVIGFVSVFALPLAALLLHVAFRRDDIPPSVALWLGMSALAAGLVLAVDIVFIRDVFSSRMNTVFKFYYQVWALWGVAAVVAVWWVASQLAKWQRGVFVALVALLSAAALVYPAATLGRSLNDGRTWSLQGQTPRHQVAGGSESLLWLRNNAAQGAVIVEAVGGQYDIEGLGYAGVSASTGLPAIMGWPGHESQWRGGHPEANNQIWQREQDVQTIYTSGDANVVRDLLTQYRVTYIYVGPTERIAYGEAGLAVFDQIADVVFSEGDVVIYQVRS